MLDNFFIERPQSLYDGIGVGCYQASPLPFLKPRSGLALNSHVDSNMRFFRSDLQSISTSSASNSFSLFSGMVSSGGSLPPIGQSFYFKRLFAIADKLPISHRSHDNIDMRQTPPGISVSTMNNSSKSQIILWTNAEWEATRIGLYDRDDVVRPEPVESGGMPIEFRDLDASTAQFWHTGKIQVTYSSDAELGKIKAALRTVLVPPAEEMLILEEVGHVPSFRGISTTYDELKAAVMMLPSGSGNSTPRMHDYSGGRLRKIQEALRTGSKIEPGEIIKL